MKGRAAIAAIVAFVIVATLGAVLAVRMTARSIDETAAVQAAEAPEIARLYIAKYGSLAAAAPTIVRRISRAGLHVTLLDRATGRWYGTAGALGVPRERSFAGPPPANVPPGPRPDMAPPGDGPGPPPGAHGLRRADWLGIVVGALVGETVHRAAVTGGELSIFPEPGSILAVVQTAALGLAFVLALCAAALWLCMREIRRAALRPLTETTLALQRLALRDFSPRTIMAGGGSAYDELARAYNAAVEAVASAFAERRAAEAEMQRFIADAGHELRTPLTIVMGYLDLIAGGALADPAIAHRITSGMRTEAMRMRKLIDKLIILARMEAPSELDARTNIDIVALIARVIESLEPLTAQPIDVRGVPFAHVFANEDELAEALTNIIENGLKYAPLSALEIAVERTGDRVVVAVADRGPGMSTDEQRNAFERFYRGEQRGEVSGSGLGLAIAKRAIERSGGTIRLASLPGRGTTFTLELPELPIALGDSQRSHLAHR